MLNLLKCILCANAVPLQFMFSEVLGEGIPGRRTSPWSDYVREDLDKIGLLNNW